jgi:hypothetical protein
MPAIGVDDPEMSYRRGYEHGAVEMFRAVERFLDPATRGCLLRCMSPLMGHKANSPTRLPICLLLEQSGHRASPVRALPA